MKNLLKVALLASLAFSTTANANPVVIAESQNGNRLLAAPGSFSVTTNNQGVLVANVITFWASSPENLMIVAIRAESCSSDGGEMILAPATNPENIERYYWHRSGTRIYDEVARQICPLVIRHLNKVEPEKEEEESEDPGQSV